MRAHVATVLTLLVTTPSCAPHTTPPPRTAPPRTAMTSSAPPSHPLPSLEAIAPQLDAMVAPLVAGHWIDGAVIALVSGEHTLVRGYGHASDGGPPPDENTLFEIGSVTKTFTGLVFADMLTRHEVAIDTTVQSLLPVGATAPGAPDRPMLLVDLATHLSGLPRLPSTFHPADPQNPYADFHDAETLAALRTTTLSATPGTRYEYSNFGYGLLGWLLARKAHTSYGQLVADRITTPLGMTDTSVDLTPAVRARLAPGHDADGDLAGPWVQDASAGAGAIRSTARDMLRYVRAQIDPPPQLAEAIETSHAIRFETSSPRGYVALGWHLWHDRRTYWHNGGTGGYHAYVAFDPNARVGVVVLANTEASAVDDVGANAVHLLRGGAAVPITLPPSITLDDTQLERVAGTYEIAPGTLMVVTHTPGVLRARLGNQPAFRIHPASPSEFRYRVVDASLTFEFDATGRANVLTLHQNGRALRAPRVADIAR